MGEPVLDSVTLRVMAFAHPSGIDILLTGLQATRAHVPLEVYALDEDDERDDAATSEIARGLRLARRRVEDEPSARAARYQRWLTNAQQLHQSFRQGRLVSTPLSLAELAVRAQYQDQFGIGRGEAACIVLALRRHIPLIFVSSDAKACRIASDLGIPVHTLLDVLTVWTEQTQPGHDELDELLNGMAQARFQVTSPTVDMLHALIAAE